MNTKLFRLIPALILLLAAAPGRAAMLGLGAGAAGRSAVRAQVPVLLNQFFAAPSPMTRGALLTGLSLTGNDPLINNAVRLSVAQNLGQLDVEAARVANAPGAADPDNAVMQAQVAAVSGYQAFVLETLQLPHVSQHLTKAQRRDVAQRAAAYGVVLTPEKADKLILQAQEEVEKLISGTRAAESVEPGSGAAPIGETPRGPVLSKPGKTDPAVLARAAIPTPAGLAEARKEDAARNTRSFYSLANVAGLAGAAAVFAGNLPLGIGLGAAAALLAGLMLMSSLSPRAGAAAARSGPIVFLAAAALAGLPLLIAGLPLAVYSGTTFVALSLMGASLAREGRPLAGAFLAALSFTSAVPALAALLPQLGAFPLLVLSLGAALAPRLLSLMFPSNAPDASAAAGPGRAVLGLAAAALVGLAALSLLVGGTALLWASLFAPSASTVTGIILTPMLSFAAVVAGTALGVYGVPGAYRLAGGPAPQKEV